MGRVAKSQSSDVGRVFIGVDPGGSGGAYALDSRGRIVSFCRFAKHTPSEVVDWFRENKHGVSAEACLEQVAARPGQGVSSSFKFGTSYGFLHGVLLSMRIPFVLATPQKWQKSMKCMSGGDKKIPLAAAQRLWPKHKFTLDVADACLIAEYHRRGALGLFK